MYVKGRLFLFWSVLRLGFLPPASGREGSGEEKERRGRVHAYGGYSYVDRRKAPSYEAGLSFIFLLSIGASYFAVVCLEGREQCVCVASPPGERWSLRGDIGFWIKETCCVDFFRPIWGPRRR